MNPSKLIKDERLAMPQQDAKHMIIVSACLAGVPCACYPSYIEEDDIVTRLVSEGRAIPVCPEQLGGLPTPRPPAGFLGGTAEDFWTGSGDTITRVVSTDGTDFSEPFLAGSREVLRIAQLASAKEVILNDGSPSCGVTRTSVYDEDRNLKYVPGCGALTWLLRENGIDVYAQGTYDI
jgi:uncharacterized protein YbbK (DUF523 family)